MKNLQNDEINLIDLFQTLWNGKWIISAFAAIAVLLGSGFLFLKDAQYVSKLRYSMDTIPPFYDKDQILNNFKKKFYSNSVFKEWKQNNSNTSIVFEDFSTTKMVDGFVFSKGENTSIVKFVSERGKGLFVLIKSNELPLLDDIFKYLIHINGLLTDEYVVRAKEELKIINTRFNEFAAASSNIINSTLSVERYIVSVEKGGSVLTIYPPSIPRKISPNPSLILLVSLVLGGMVGVFFILVCNSIKNRQEYLAKT